MKLLFAALFLMAIPTLAAIQNCTDQELKERNCLVELDGVKISVRDQSLFLFANKKIQIVPHPFASPSAQWKSANIRRVSNHLVFEFIGWDIPGFDGSQNLLYSVFGIKNNQLKFLIQDTIQKRSVDQKTRQFIYSAKDNIKLDSDGKNLFYSKGNSRQALAFP